MFRPGGAPNSLCYHDAFPEPIEMKRVPFLGAALLLATLAPSTLSAATVGGKVSFVTKRGQNPVAAETLVWLEPAARVASRRPASFQMVTRGKTLVPHVLAIPAGSTVDFPNDDPISHNLFSLSSGNAFDLGLYRKGAGKSYKFDKPGLVNVYCNVHPSMSAVIHVLTTPYFAFADAAGSYAIADVPPGKYRLVAWNEQGGQSESPIEVTGAGQVTGSVALTLDSRNFRQASHTNKEGKPYSPASSREY
jgi:plastocyanin